MTPDYDDDGVCETETVYVMFGEQYNGFIHVSMSQYAYIHTHIHTDRENVSERVAEEKAIGKQRNGPLYKLVHSMYRSMFYVLY